MSEKNNTVLASGSLPSPPLPSPLTPILLMRFFFSSHSYDPGKCLEIRLCTEGVCSLPSSHHSSLLLGSRQLTSTSPPDAAQPRVLSLSTQPSQGSLVRVAEPNPWQSSPPETSHNVYAVLIVVCLWART